jgi:glyoxylase I family protein
MILGLHHIGIATTDLDKMLAFYGDIFGFEIVARGEWQPGSARHDALTALTGSAARYCVLRRGHTYLELFGYTAPAPKPGDPDRPVSDAGITHLCLAVDDIDAEYARLTAAGVRFHTEPGPRGPMRATYGRDPEGNVFELIEFSDPAHPFRFLCEPALLP